MANRRRTLGIKIETPGGDNPLRMRLANKRPNAPIYAGIDIGDRLALVGQGGHPPYAFSILSGGDTNGGVNGLTLHTDGTFEGTPEDSGRFAFVAEVQDSSSATFPASFSLTFLPQLVWVRFEPVPGENLLHYSYRMLARDLSGNDITTGYQLVAGNLPDGLMLHDNGIIDGDPSFAAIGISYATIRAQGVGGHLDVNITIEIFGPLLGFSVEDPPRYYAGNAFIDQDLTTFPTGGNRPYRYRWDNLEDFPWLSFDYNIGKFSGTPPIANIGVQQTVTGTVTDAVGAVLEDVRFAFIIVYAQQGVLIGDIQWVPVTGTPVYGSSDGSIVIEPDSDGGLDFRAIGGGSGAIQTINGVGPDPGHNIDIDGIVVDSNGDLTVDFPASTSGHSPGCIFTNGGLLLTGTLASEIHVPYSGTITGWTIFGDEIGNASIIVSNATYANYDTMTTLLTATCTSAKKAQATGLSVAVVAGALRFSGSGFSGFSRCSIVLEIS
jgi:hypothetical protein